jgi:uncharacterized protein (UPF0335 family)
MMQEKEVIAKLVGLFDQINTIDEGVKAVKAEAKESGFNPAILANVAKAISDGKVSELRKKLEITLDILDNQDS